MNFKLAPAAVIRAAAWPIETLDAFGDPGLADLSPSSPSFETAYAATLDRERSALWQRTGGDPRFLKALLFASPSLFARLRESNRGRSLRNKSVRHLETSLYRYLSRAAGRATPHGLWSGVAIARFGSQQQVQPAPTVAEFAPNLAPFATALRILANRADYRRCSQWGLSPALRSQLDGSWQFFARDSSGRVDLRQIEANPQLSPCLDRLSTAGTGTLQELSTRTNVPMEIIERLAAGGVLVGGLGFPAAFSSVWEALTIAADALLSADRSAWKRTTTLLVELSEALSEQIDQPELEKPARLVTQARNVILELFSHLGVEVPLPASPLRCDLRLPFRVTLADFMQKQLHESLHAYQQQWIDSLSPSAAARRDRRCGVVETLRNTPLQFGNQLPSGPPPNPATIAAWAATFKSCSEQVRLQGNANDHAACSSPWGSLLARLGPGGVVRVLGMDDNPIRPLGRHSSILGRENEAEVWVKEVFSRFTGQTGLNVGEIAVPLESNPNVMARPDFNCLRIEPWGIRSLALRGAELQERAGAIVFNIPSLGSFIVLSSSPVPIRNADPLASLIAMGGFDEPADLAFPATSLAAPGEADQPRFAPRLVLSSGASLRPRRTLLSGSSLSELTRRPRQERYSHWCQLARQLGWPERVTLSIDGGTALTVPTSSPLAIEAAFEGAGHAAWIVVEEADSAAWLPGPSGHHVTEVIVPFSRDPHAFSGITSSGVPSA